MIVDICISGDGRGVECFEKAAGRWNLWGCMGMM